MGATYVIERLDRRGDGVAAGPDGAVAIAIAGALPGERVLAGQVQAGRAQLVEIIEASPDRVAPSSPHFGACGGCSAQHMSAALYRAWKLGLLRQALARAGLEPEEIAPAFEAPPRSRRRLTFALARPDGAAVLGFHRARSHEVVPIVACAIADPAIERALPDLRAWLAPLAPAHGSLAVTVLASPSGLDVAVDAPPAAARRLVATAGLADPARLSARGEVLAAFRPVVLDVGGVVLEPPPGGFVQPVAEAEAVLAEEALRAVAGAKRVADLFSGAGAFALRLARHMRVDAFEGDAPAVEALSRAARGARGLKPVTAQRRDLFRNPVQARELAAYDAAVLDPPRQGAAAQVEAIAKSAVKRVAYVSCAPDTFARDAERLVAAGFTLERVKPVDQFLWSSHIELAAAFRR
jgi:23S rRNA (uracil1939-C5)-methyltransferase